MSTYLYLECLDHNPPLRSEGESGQHLYDLHQLRRDIRHRNSIVAAVELDMWDGHDHFRRNTAAFLFTHRECALRIRDEYGIIHSLEDDESDMRVAPLSDTRGK